MKDLKLEEVAWILEEVQAIKKEQRLYNLEKNEKPVGQEKTKNHSLEKSSTISSTD